MLPWKAISAHVADLVIPPLCVHCDGRLERISDVLCDGCISLLEPVAEDCCPKCGSPMDESYCSVCAETEFRFRLARSPWMFSGPVQSMVHKLKYDLFVSPVSFLARGITTVFKGEAAFAAADVITSVPLHRVRKRERTFNQSELLARALAKETGLPYEELLRRGSYTRSQTKLSRNDRLKNLKGAFSLRSKAEPNGRKVILVDDVFTTGSTVNEVSGLLLDNGATEVLVLTAARAG